MNDMKKSNEFEKDWDSYAARMNPRAVSSVLDDLSQTMSANYRQQAEMLRLVERTVRQASDGAPSLMRVWFLDFGREVYGRWRRCPKVALEPELQIMRHKWTVRGLDPQTLEKVEKAVLDELHRTIAEVRGRMSEVRSAVGPQEPDNAEVRDQNSERRTE